MCFWLSYCNAMNIQWRKLWFWFSPSTLGKKSLVCQGLSVLESLKRVSVNIIDEEDLRKIAEIISHLQLLISPATNLKTFLNTVTQRKLSCLAEKQSVNHDQISVLHISVLHLMVQLPSSRSEEFNLPLSGFWLCIINRRVVIYSLIDALIDFIITRSHQKQKAEVSNGINSLDKGSATRKEESITAMTANMIP
ncbi:hypothetical protein Tco_1083803 [Tanacetum coccineum]